MQIKHNISLKNYNTFGIDVKAKHFVSATSNEDLIAILNLKEYSNTFILGGGSNMLLTKDIDALVIHVDLKGIAIVNENENRVTVQANAGENWHEFVLWCIKHGFGGLENLSLIPGNVGTAPIQNIGAYGVELKDVFESCEALDLKTKTFSLSKQNHKLHTNYGAIALQLETMGIKRPTISDVSKAVIAIRESKLPNPKKIGNSGSFFKNPIISLNAFNALKQQFPEIPSYVISDTEVKVPAGWLIEKAGFKGKTFGAYGVHKNQALVLVNYADADGKDILNLSKLIQSTVKRIFNISIEAEVNIL